MLQAPTREMRTEVAATGTCHSTLYNRDYTRMQIRKVKELLDGTGFDLPPRTDPFVRARSLGTAAADVPLGI